jgi:hypothetical protein
LKYDLQSMHPYKLQRKIVKLADLEKFRKQFNGQTAEGIAKRIINRFRPGAHELAKPSDREGGMAEARQEIVDERDGDVVTGRGQELPGANGGELRREIVARISII